MDGTVPAGEPPPDPDRAFLKIHIIELLDQAGSSYGVGNTCALRQSYGDQLLALLQRKHDLDADFSSQFLSPYRR